MNQKLLSTVFGLFLAMSGYAHGQTAKPTTEPLRIGVLGDQSGVFSGMSGKGAIEAVKMAVEDFGGQVLGRKIEVVSADHQNKADIAAGIAGKWFDTDGVEMITDLVGSASALAVIEVAKRKNRIAIVNAAAAADIAGLKCTPNSILYTIETGAIAKGVTTSLLRRGKDTWYFISADYAFGKSLEKEVTEIVLKNNGKVIGSVRHPTGASDFSSFLLQAQASKAKVIAIASGGDDAVNVIKTAREFGVGRDDKQTLIGLLIMIDSVHALGLDTAQGLTFVDSFYWDQDKDSREFSQRFFKRMGRMPGMTHAGDYSSTLHYLNAVKAAGSTDAAEVMRKMKEMPVNDIFAHGGKIREDGLHVHDMLLVQVKKPSESKGPWDYYKVLEKIPADRAFKPLSESACPLVKGKT